MTGSQLHATFQILRKIAQTNSGTVFRAQNRTTKEIVAIKVHHKRGKNAAFVYNEAKLQAELSHPNIVSLLGFADLRDDVYIVQQVRGGKEYFSWIERIFFV
jgi:serine/threonine protein kinase